VNHNPSTLNSIYQDTFCVEAVNDETFNPQPYTVTATEKGALNSKLAKGAFNPKL